MSPGRFDLTVSDGQVSVTKNVAVGGRVEGVSSMRTGEHWFTSLLYPGEAPSKPVSHRIHRNPLSRTRHIHLGKNMNWLILFLVLSLGFGYAFKGLLGVKIYVRTDTGAPTRCQIGRRHSEICNEKVDAWIGQVSQRLFAHCLLFVVKWPREQHLEISL